MLGEISKKTTGVRKLAYTTQKVKILHYVAMDLNRNSIKN